jgi:diaminohydroxyphosphoribosylaminopyrimidine deaminase/5-amino-6-(5-phosphoribosylamino)uracil reductase
MVLDRTLRLDENLRVFDQSAPTWIFTAGQHADWENNRYFTLDFEQDIIPQLLTILYEHNILSLIVEGGSILLKSFLKTGLWEEAFIYTGNQFFGKGVKAPQISGDTVAIEILNDCKLHVVRNSLSKEY